MSKEKERVTTITTKDPEGNRENKPIDYQDPKNYDEQLAIAIANSLAQDPGVITLPSSNQESQLSSSSSKSRSESDKKSKPDSPQKQGLTLENLSSLGAVEEIEFKFTSAPGRESETTTLNVTIKKELEDHDTISIAPSVAATIAT